MGRRALYLLTLILAGCAVARSSVIPPNAIRVDVQLPQPPPATLPTTQTFDQHVVICFDKSLDYAATQLYREAVSRFVNPVVVLGHGDTDENSKKWMLYGDFDRGGMMEVAEVARVMSRRFPDRDIVLFVCNAKGHQINVPRVWYFRAVVWTMPDRDAIAYERSLNDWELFWYRVNTRRETQRNYGSAGSIWEAVTQSSTVQ